MATDRFKQYQYNLHRYFRNKGYEINTKSKTIKANLDTISFKDSKRLIELQKYGFTVIDLASDNRESIIAESTPDYLIVDELCDDSDFDNNGSILDFVDEVLYRVKHDLY